MADLLAKRFTQTLVRDMAKHLASQSFDQKIADLHAQEKAIGDELYNIFFAEHMDLMNSLPEGWLEKVKYVRVKLVKGDREARTLFDNFVEFDYSYEQSHMTSVPLLHLDWKMSEERPVPHYLRYQYLPLQVDSDIFKRMLENNNLIAEMEKKRCDFRIQMISYLTSVKSFKGLYATWPEVREVLRDFEPTSSIKSMLPAAPLEEYNKLLGIPSEKAITATT
ncbi:Nmad5 family putative nucleotide modification protein [Acinetobacter baumannii]|nr:Nmad5 family putative nucleotide modification protein [Acinetobacter baumannii]